MPPIPRSRFGRRTALLGVVLLAVTIVITVVAAQNTSAKPTVDPKIARLPPYKQTAMAPRATKIAENATAHPEWRNLPATVTPGPPIQGIQYKYPIAWRMHSFPSNEWFGSVNGQPTAVYAGTDSTWDGHGIVYNSG